MITKEGNVQQIEFKATTFSIERKWTEKAFTNQTKFSIRLSVKAMRQHSILRSFLLLSMHVMIFPYHVSQVCLYMYRFLRHYFNVKKGNVRNTRIPIIPFQCLVVWCDEKYKWQDIYFSSILRIYDYYW